MAHDFTMLSHAQTNMLSYSNYPSNPILAQRSIRCLVVHSVADPNIFNRIQDTLQHKKKSSTKASSSSNKFDNKEDSQRKRAIYNQVRVVSFET